MQEGGILASRPIAEGYHLHHILTRTRKQTSENVGRGSENHHSTHHQKRENTDELTEAFDTAVKSRQHRYKCHRGNE